MRFIAAVLLGLLASPHISSAADFNSRNEFDLGATSNAYLTKDLPKSDMFAYVSTSNYLKTDSNEFGLRLSYTGYFNEKPNDVITLRAGDEYTSGAWSYSGAIIGQRYPSGSPASTDVSFDSIGAEVRADSARDIGDQTEIDFGGGYRFRDYTGFSNRLDNTAFGSLVLQHTVNPKLTLSATGDAEANISTQSDYSRLYFNVGAVADYKLSSDWTSTTELALSTSQYLSRTVSTIVVTSNRKGVKTTATGNQNESTSAIFLSTGALKKEGESFRWGAEVNTTSQVSRSGAQDYSVFTLLGKAVIVF